MGIFDWFSKKDTFEKDTLKFGENHFIYYAASGEVSLKHVEIQSFDEDKNQVQAIDLTVHEPRTYKLDRVLKVFGTKELKKLSEEDMHNIIDEIVEDLVAAAEEEQISTKVESWIRKTPKSFLGH